MPSNREWALIFWAAVIAAWAFSRREVRPSLAQALCAAGHPKILVPLAGMAGWVGCLVWGGSQVGLWISSLTTATVIWFLASALRLLFRSTNAWKTPHFFRREAVATAAPMAILQPLVDAVVLPLLTEIVLQLAATFLVVLSAVAAGDERAVVVKRIASVLLALIGLLVLGNAVVNLVTGWQVLDKGKLLLQVLLPAWLTIGLLPFVYLFALYAAYEMAFVRMDLKIAQGWWGRLRNKMVLVASFGFRGGRLHSFTGRWQLLLGKATSLSEARRVVRDFRFEQEESLRIETEKRERLARYAGVDGVGGDGRRLDRREFEQTTDALYWLATCMMGWHRNLGRYRTDMLETLGEDFSRHGLPKPSGTSIHVTQDGQSWYAWRRTVTGWCFAIGAAGPPPEQWEYDGPDPPNGFPREDPSWGDGPFSHRVDSNW